MVNTIIRWVLIISVVALLIWVVRKICDKSFVRFINRSWFRGFDWVKGKTCSSSSWLKSKAWPKTKDCMSEFGKLGDRKHV